MARCIDECRKLLKYIEEVDDSIRKRDEEIRILENQVHAVIQYELR